MGRDKRNEQRTEHFTKMVRTTMGEPAWRALSPIAQALYPWLKLEWRGAEANNNGNICLSVRQASNRLGVGKDAAARAFRELQAKGFLVAHRIATLGFGGNARGTAYEITELPMPQTGSNQGRRLYKDWRAGNDYPVAMAPTHNPTGSNQKTKPCHDFRDGQVIEIGTRAGFKS